MGGIEEHYGRAGLAATILKALAENGQNVGALTAEMLYPLDQLHGRQIAATREHLPRLQLDEGKHVLDVGSGIGGPARFMAATWGCRVTGIDLTAEFVAAAKELTARCGLSGKVDFRRGDALHMPFADASFDRAACLHVAMNIADKAGLLREIRRVVKPGARLVWSEIVLTGGGAPPDYPLPWARDPSVSFLGTAETLRPAFAAAGYRVAEWADETDLYKAYSVKQRETPPSPLRQLTNQVVLGDDFMDRIANLNRSFNDGRLRTVLVVAEAA